MNCKICGRYYHSEQTEYNKDGYCSAHCGTNHQHNGLIDARRDFLNKKIHVWGYAYCSKCGKKFYVGTDYAHSSYCRMCQKILDEESKKSMLLYKFNYTKFQCDWCGKYYFRINSTAILNQVYCSKKCESNM